jgi:hypothetical protein
MAMTDHNSTGDDPMFDFHATNARGRSKFSLGRKAVLGAAFVLGAATSSQAGPGNCAVTFAVSNATQIEALQFESTLSPGAVALGDFNACAAVPSGITDFNTDANTLEVGWATDGGAFSGPGDFVTCNFNAPAGVPTLAPSDFSAIATLDCTKSFNPFAVCGPAPTYSVTIGDCSSCGNGVVEPGEQCEAPDPNCNGATCTLLGSCTPQPLVGCKTGAAGKSKLQVKDNADNAKDSAQYAFGAGAATTLDEFKDPVNTAGVAYRLCVYDGDGLVAAHEVPSQGTCDGVDCWKPASTKGFGYKNKGGLVGGITQIKLTSGDDGKAKASIKLKSKTAFAAPTLPLVEPTVKAQLVIDDGGTPVCFETAFPAAAKNDDAQYSVKGP